MADKIHMHTINFMSAHPASSYGESVRLSVARENESESLHEARLAADGKRLSVARENGSESVRDA